MTNTGQLMWLQTPIGFGERRQIHFMLGLGTGLMDADFHPITERNWSAMASPSADAIAVLDAPAEATLAQLNAALQMLAAKGGYGYVQLVMR